MANARDRERRDDDFDLADASRRSMGGDRPYLNDLPVPLFQPKKGPYNLDVCLYKTTVLQEKFNPKMNVARTGQYYYERSFATHRGIGVNGEQHICLSKTYGLPCPACEERARLTQDPKTRNTREVKDAVAALFWSIRQLILVHDQDEKDQKNRSIQLFDTSNHAFGKQLDSKIKNARPELAESYKTFYDPRGGYTLRVVFEDTPMGDGGSYLKATIDDMIPRKKGLSDEFWKHGLNPEEFLSPLDYKSYVKIFTMQASSPDEVEADDRPARGRGRDEEEAPTRGRGRNREEDDEPKSRRGRGDDTPGRGGRDADEPAVADAGFKAGDKVAWEYRDKKYAGEIDEVNEDRGIAYCIDAENPKDRPHVVDLKDLEAIDDPADPQDDLPPRGRGRGGRDEDEPRSRRGGRGEEADDRPARGRGGRDEDEPRGRGGRDEKPFKDTNGDEPQRGRGREEEEPTTARRGRGR